MKKSLATLAVATAALVLASVLPGCASQDKLRTQELAALAAQLPGQYDNLSQVRAEAAAGARGAHAAQALTILRLRAPLVADDVFLVRETAVGDARRVIAERIWSLSVLADGRLYGAVYQFDEPDRWQGGAASPELFTSLLMRDLRVLPGCELLWTKGAQGYSGDTPPAGCRRSGGDGAQRMSEHWRLAGAVLAFAELAPGTSAAEADAARRAAAADPFYLFERRGEAR